MLWRGHGVLIIHLVEDSLFSVWVHTWSGSDLPWMSFISHESYLCSAGNIVALLLAGLFFTFLDTPFGQGQAN